MSRLYFECRFKTYKLRSLDLPIEVRKPNLTLVIQCRSSQSVELKAGTYYLIARLPTDQKLYGKIQLAEGIDMLAILTSDEDKAASEVQEMLHFLGGLQGTILPIDQPESLDSGNNSVTSRRSGDVMALLRTVRDSLLSLITRTSHVEPVNAKLRLYRGNVLQDHCSVVHTDDWLSPLEDGRPVIQRPEHSKVVRWLSKSNKFPAGEDLRVARFSISGLDSPQLIQLLQPQMSVINVMLPVSLSYKCSLDLKQLPNGSCAVDIHLANAEADLLLRYLQEGQLAQGDVLTASEQQVREALLNLKWDDPIAAAVGAYALLRFNDLSRLKGWTEDLSSRFAWLPDGIAIRGEYLARIGEHNQALTLFIDLPSRGLPVFSDGFSYIIDRLRLYTGHGIDLFESEKLSQVQTLLKRLQEIAFFVDFRQSLLTFNGIDPGIPESNPLEADITSYEGRDIATLLYPPRSKRRSLLAVIRDIRLKKVIASLWAYFGKYGASLLGIGVIIPVIAALITLIFYLSFNLLSPFSFLTILEGGWRALLFGVFFAGVIWVVLPTLYSSFVFPQKANARSYRALKGRLHELESRLGINEFSGKQKKSLTLEERKRAVRFDPDERLFALSALDEAYGSYTRVSEEIEEPHPDLRWMLGTGYIKVWRMLHRAEEALVQFEPVAQVIRSTIRTNVRIQNSSIGNRIPLLRLSRQAVKNADSTAGLATVTRYISSNVSFNEQKAVALAALINVEDKGGVSSNASFNGKQVMARVAARLVRQVFNEYRDDLWRELVQKRNLLLGQILVTGIATYILLCFAIFISNPTTIIEATFCYIVGSIAGLIRPLLRILKRDTAIDDYGFSWTYVMASCLFSGLMAVFGLLVIGRLDIPDLSSVDLLTTWLHVFGSNQLANIPIAVFFGLLSNLYFRGFVQRIEKIESDLLQSNAPQPGDVALPIS